MSGLLGIWNSQQPAPWQQMLRDLDVLGPNGAGDWHGLNGKLSLGRTQFFDTPESCSEPPVIEYQGCVLVWEGRLDDRESLLTGHSQPATDGQLLIESYRRWGIDCIDRLTGEFAFILWDASNDLFVVGCDPVGKHTLAYFWDGQTLLLSSRVLTLLRHPQVSRELDPLYLANTLCCFYGQKPGSTPFTDIKRLLAGHALIMKADQLQNKQIAKINFPERYDTLRSPESYYDEFWEILNKSVKDRLRTIHRPCTTLSGGLDSTTVTVSLLNHLPQIDAFSTVTSIYPEFDERESIDTFLQMYPQTHWHPLNSDHAWSLSEPWEKLPVVDDPLISCTLPMNLHLMEHIQQQGCSLIFDGEWGDNICAVGFSDLVRTGRWGKIQQYLRQEERWLSLCWRGFLLPILSAYWQRQWFTWRQPHVLPTWITPSYLQSHYAQSTIQQGYESMLVSGLQENINWALTAVHSVANSRICMLMKAAHGLSSTSPFQDRRLIEFSINLPPELQADPTHGKIFLRQANQNHLPEQIRWRPKTNYFDPVKYAGLAKGQLVVKMLSSLKNIPCLENIIDPSELEKMLIDYRAGYSQNYSPGYPYRNREANHLYALFSFVNWHQNMINPVSGKRL
jgi:asparagine synthase (glutamine-hydrolysing)